MQQPKRLCVFRGTVLPRDCTLTKLYDLTMVPLAPDMIESIGRGFVASRRIYVRYLGRAMKSKYDSIRVY